MKTINTSPTYSSTVHNCKVVDLKNISDSAFVITFEKPDFEFTAGQHVIVSLVGDIHDREYSISSSEEDKNMEILVKEVKDDITTFQFEDFELLGYKAHPRISADMAV